jgi:hypothetical protein
MNEQFNHNHDGDPQLLYVTLVLDESGSMESCKGAAIAGFNQYVAMLRQEQAATRFTLTLFNSMKTEVRYRDIDLSAVQPLTAETYQPDHGTPLYDAIGYTLSAARRAAPPEAKKLCVILTDGEENASREYTREHIAFRIKAFERQGWTFLYLGADHDVWAAGESIGILPENRVPFDKRRVGETFVELSQNTARYRRRDKADRSPLWETKPSGRHSNGRGNRPSQNGEE